MKPNKDNHYLSMDDSPLLNELGTLAFKKNIPLYTTIELTQDCNFRCSHCYNFDRTLAQRVPSEGKPLSYPEWLDVIDQVMDEGAFYICFTGGEVLLYSRIWGLIERVHSRNGMVKLKSNGAALTDDVVKRIIDLRVHALEISIYGMSEKTYEKFTAKKGMFHKVIDGLERLKTESVTVDLNLILSKDNVCEFPQMVELAQNLGFKFNVSDEISKRYDNSASSLDYNLTQDQYLNLLQGPHGEYFMLRHDMGNHSFQCACARNVCGIGFNGDIFPCIGAPIKAGNILESSFHEIWNYSPFFNRLRKVKNEDFSECMRCEVAEYCNRSSGSAYVNTGNYFGCDQTSLKIARFRKSHISK